MDDSTKTKLSDAEHEVLRLLAFGYSPAQICQSRHVTLNTVRSQIKAIHRKLDTTSISSAVAYYWLTKNDDLVAAVKGLVGVLAQNRLPALINDEVVKVETELYQWNYVNGVMSSE